MKLVYTSENRILLENVKNVLHENGIETRLKNQFLSSGIGELAPIDTWPELWLIDEQDFDRAQALIDSLSKDDEAPGWQCCSCAEPNEGTFEVCWNCATQRPELSSSP